ncbi:hypothetical protein NCPPB3923_24385, partial [Burkholderia glumae]
MNTSREEFLLRVRAAQRIAVRHDDDGPAPDDPHPLPALPRFATPAGARLERFCANLATMGGRHAAPASHAELPAWFAAQFPG